MTWPGREIWAHPDYSTLFVGPYETPILLFYENRDRRVIFPLVLRPIPPSLAGTDDLFDLVGPYGYGGPYVDPKGCSECPDFWAAIEEWARSTRCVSLFSRLDLDPSLLLPDIPAAMTVAMNVVRGLDLSEHDLWLDFDHKVRKNVKRAIREGVELAIDQNGDSLDEFLAVYHSTLRRRGAAGSSFLPRSFFERLVATLKGHFAIFNALHDGSVIATELVLLSEKRAYSFLGGTLDQHTSKRPNDFLKYEIIRWARAMGKSEFVLGGGFVSGPNKGNDGIFNYKKSFAPRGIRPFRVMRWILDQQRYAELVYAWEAAAGVATDPLDGYFPAYRKALPSVRQDAESE